MAVIPVKDLAPADNPITTQAASAGGDTYETGDRTFLYVQNDGASAITVTIAQKKPDSQGFLTHSLSVSVGASQSHAIYAPPKWFANEKGEAEVSYSDVTSVFVGAFRMV